MTVAPCRVCAPDICADLLRRLAHIIRFWASFVTAAYMAIGPSGWPRGQACGVGRTRTGTKRDDCERDPLVMLLSDAVALISATSAISASPVPTYGSSVVEGGGEQRRPDETRVSTIEGSPARRRLYRISAPLISCVPAPCSGRCGKRHEPGDGSAPQARPGAYAGGGVKTPK